MSGVEKCWEGICPRWRNVGREYVWGGEVMGGNMSGVEK